MKIVFLSNYFTHHQSPICKEWFKLTDGSFSFISTEDFSESRKLMGWNEEASVSFVYHYNDETNKNISYNVNNCDALLFGSAPRFFIQDRLKGKKTVFLYSERIYKKGYNYLKWPIRLFKFWLNYGRYSSLYLLSASAYTVNDYAKHGVFINKSYKWGYFPKTKYYDINNLLNAKKRNKIIWCGRFINYKHPEIALRVAKKLKTDGYNFELNLIGSGEKEELLKNEIIENNLSDSVKILGAMTPEQVRNNMETAGIFLFTSDFEEGWGAVLNEAMNSGCAVVASHAIGSVPFLVNHKKNGFVYENGNFDDLYTKVKFLLGNPDEQFKFGFNAYHTIIDLWNAEIAAKRFIQLVDEINNHGFCDLFTDGPCSRAKIIRNNWFKEYE